LFSIPIFIFQVCAVIIILILIFGAVIVRHIEYKEYNNGICTKCGGHLRSFDMDSQGGTGWNCIRCGYSFWTSWVE